MFRWVYRIISRVINSLPKLDKRIDTLLDRYNLFVRSRVSRVRILGEHVDRDLRQVFVDLGVVHEEAVEYSDFITMMNTGMRRQLNPFSELNTTVGAVQNDGRKFPPEHLLRNNTKAFITGVPGCGKTTLLKYLALQVLDKQNLLLIWIELKALDKNLFTQAESTAFKTGNLILAELWLAYLTPQLSLTEREQNYLRGYWRTKLAAGELRVLMDGFDELQDEEVENSLSKCINQFISALPSNTLLITTRPYAQHKLGAEGFQELQIEPLNDTQIGAFLNSYYPNDPAVTQLLNSLRERSVLRELLNVPLLLGIILRLCRENRFIDDRLKLYDLIINDLVRELDRSKSVVRQFRITDERLRLEFLRNLALDRLLVDPLESYSPHDNRLVFTYNVLKEKAEAFLTRQRISHNPRDLADDALATPLLRELSPDLFAFTQLTLQEYLAASALASLYDKNQIDGLRLFCGAYYDATLVEMEVLPITLGATSNSKVLYGELEDWPDSFTLTNLRLRLRGLGYRANIVDERRIKLLDQIWQKTIQPSNDESAYTRMLLNSLWVLPDQSRQYLETKTIPYLNERSGFSYLRAIEALAVLATEQSFDPIVNSLSSRRGDGIIAGSFSGLEESFLHYASRALVRIDGNRAAHVLSTIRTRYSYGDLDRVLKQVGTEEAFRAILVRRKAGFNVDWYTSKAIDEIVRQSETRGIIEQLIEALTNPRAEIRGFAVDTLGIIGIEEAVIPIAERLKDSDFAVKWKAATALEYIGSETAVGPLIEALSDEADTVRWCAASALGQLRSADALEALIQRLHDPSTEVQYHSADALAWIGSEQAVEPLLSLLASDAAPKVRSMAAYAFYRIRSGRTVDALITYLQDPNVEVRAGAALALGGQQAPKAVEPLIRCLEDPAEDVRANAAFALGRIGSENAVPFLISTFRENQNPRVREYSIKSLGQIGSENVVEHLVLASSFLFDSGHAVEALAQIRPAIFATALPKLLEHEENRVRLKAVATVSYYSDSPQLLTSFLALETDPDHDIKVAAKHAGEQLTRKLELLSRPDFGPSSSPILDNESREGILLGEVTRIVSEAGHIFRDVQKNDWGIDGEIEFKNERGQASGQRVYLQLKSGDSYLYKRKRDDKEIFRIPSPRHALYWQSQAYPVMLVIRAHGQTRFINITEYLKVHGGNVTQVEFHGKPFNPEAINRMYIEYSKNRDS